MFSSLLALNSVIIEKASMSISYNFKTANFVIVPKLEQLLRGHCIVHVRSPHRVHV